MLLNPSDVLDFDIRDFLSDEEIEDATRERELSENDCLFWAALREGIYIESSVLPFLEEVERPSFSK